MAITPYVPQELARRLVWISDRALFDRFHLMGEAGAGKSRFLGRIFCWLLFLRFWPQFILDPTGGTRNNFLNKMTWLPHKDQEQLWPRVRYIDRSGNGDRVVGTPLYYRLHPNESLYDVSQRFLDVIWQIDPDLSSAAIMGRNALFTIGTHTGMLLAGLGHQITEAESLIRDTEAWDGQLERALSISPELKPAVAFFRNFSGLGEGEQDRKSSAFLTKILPFTADRSTQAIFGAPERGFDPAQSVKNRETVILDYSNELNRERRRFKLLWDTRTLTDFFKYRGTDGRKDPVGFIIDEVTELLGYGEAAHSVMEADIEELVSRIARNYGVAPLLIAHQNLPQVKSPAIQSALMSMGTQMIGVQSEPESRLLLAQYFHRYDPYMLKREERVWMSDMREPYVIDVRPVEFTLEEQQLLSSYEFRYLGPFEFLIRPALGEGNRQGLLRKMSIANFDRGIYPDLDWVSQAQQRLMERDGLPVSIVVGEIETRRSIDTSLLSLSSEPSFRMGEVPDEGPHWSF